MSRFEAASKLMNYSDISLDSAVAIHGRQGDTENGDSLLDLIPAGTTSALDVLVEQENAQKRIKFVKQFFTVLKQVLTEEEYKFIKLRLNTGKKDTLVAQWVGFNSASEVFRSIQDKINSNECIFKRLIARSEWDDAQVFVDSVIKSVNEVAKREDILKFEKGSIPKNKAFTALAKAVELAEYRLLAPQSYKIERRYYMRGYVHATSVLNGSGIFKRYSELEDQLFQLVGIAKGISVRLLDEARLAEDGVDFSQNILHFINEVERLAESIQAHSSNVKSSDEILNSIADKLSASLLETIAYGNGGLLAKSLNIVNPPFEVSAEEYAAFKAEKHDELKRRRKERARVLGRQRYRAKAIAAFAQLTSNEASNNV